VEGARTDEEREWARKGLREAEDECLNELRAKVLGLSQQIVEDRAPSGLIGSGMPQLPPGRAEALATAADTVAALEPPTTARGHFRQGNAFYAAGEFEKALAAYNAALELRPDHPATLNNRGNALDSLGRHEEALADYNRSLELRPDGPDALNNRGGALGDLGRHEEALADFNRSLELRPDHADTLSNRGATLLHLHRYDQALADFNRSLDLRPDHPGALYNRACAFSLMQRCSEALPDLAAAIKIDAKYRDMAREDEDFQGLRNDPEWGPKFWEIVGTEDKP